MARDGATLDYFLNTMMAALSSVCSRESWSHADGSQALEASQSVFHLHTPAVFQKFVAVSRRLSCHAPRTRFQPVTLLR